MANNTQIWVSVEVHRQLKIAAAVRGVGMQRLADTAIANYLKMTSEQHQKQTLARGAS